MNTFSRNILAGLASTGVVASLVMPALVGAVPVSQNELFQGQDPAAVSGALGVSNKGLTVTIASIIRSFLGLLGIVAVVIIIIGGFEWMTAGGAEEKVGTAKKRIMQGVIGLAIILSAFSIAQFVISSLVTATTTL